MKAVDEIPHTQQTSERNNLYYQDFYTWTVRQAEALKRRDFNAVGWDNVVEEIEDLVRSEEHRLESQYARAIGHLLKLQYRRLGETDPVAGWESSVNQARIEIEEVLRKNPGLKGTRNAVFDEA